MFLRPKACEVTLWGFVGVENLPLPAEFRYCRYAVLQFGG